MCLLRQLEEIRDPSTCCIQLREYRWLEDFSHWFSSLLSFRQSSQKSRTKYNVSVNTRGSALYGPLGQRYFGYHNYQPLSHRKLDRSIHSHLSILFHFWSRMQWMPCRLQYQQLSHLDLYWNKFLSNRTMSYNYPCIDLFQISTVC